MGVWRYYRGGKEISLRKSDRSFFKRNKPSIFAVCIALLVLTYIVIGMYYTIHPPDGFLVGGPIKRPSLWIQFYMSARLYLPELFILLAWVSFTRNRKGLYILFVLLGSGDLYFSFLSYFVEKRSFICMTWWDT